jgi:ABC-2 type transport system permease protein
VLSVVCVAVGWHPSFVQVLGILLGLMIILILSLGLGLLFGSVNVSFRDSQNLVDLVGMVVTWVSPVLYTWTAIQQLGPSWILTSYQLNPITAAVELFHAGFWYPTTEGSQPLAPDIWMFGGIALGVSLLVLVVGQLVFKKMERRFAQDL